MISKIDLERFQKSHILVMGDVMLDRYLWGDVERISPEAPVPVFHIHKSSEVAGGAGNVVSNLSGLGCEVTIIGLCGDDDSGKNLIDLLKNERVNTYLLNDTERPTITKTRIVSSGQQLIRLDDEKIFSVENDLRESLLNIVKEKIQGYQAIVISDYGKGIFQSPGLAQLVIQLANNNNIPIFVDPKGKDWDRYQYATCITPNTKELEIVYGEKIENKEALVKAMNKVLYEYDLSNLLVTRGAKGMCLLQNGRDPLFIPALAREVFDVSGAGDTVIATLALGISSGMNFSDAAKLANIAAGIVVAKIGTQPINFFELKTAIVMGAETISGKYLYKIASLSTAKIHAQLWQANGERVVFTNGCFDLLHPGHIHLLNKAKELGERLIVGLNSDESIKNLKGPNRPILNENDRASILASLDCVDMVVIFSEDTPVNLIGSLEPDVLAKGADYNIIEVVGREIVEAYGGRVALIEVLEGYSTTHITEKVINSHNSSLCSN